MTPTAPRFFSSGGTLFMDGREISLEDAKQLLDEWWVLAKQCERAGNRRLAGEYARQAGALCGARLRALEWVWASGPNAAEAYTNKVRAMLAASVEQGERA